MHKYPVIKAQKRTKRGTRAARRLRSGGRVPAVIYGRGLPGEMLSVDEETLRGIIESRAKMVELRVGSKKQAALIKDIQFGHLGDVINHVDFEGISLEETIRIEVLVETHGTPKGVREGGVLDVTHRHITVECKPGDVPSEITVEVADLAIGDIVTVGELPVPEGVKVIDEPSTVAVAVHAPRKAVEVEAEEGEEELSEPEVITARREEEEGESDKK